MSEPTCPTCRRLAEALGACLPWLDLIAVYAASWEASDEARETARQGRAALAEARAALEGGRE